MCFLLTQGQQFANQGAVVEFQRGLIGLVGGAGHVSAVQRLAQGCVVGELHDRQVAGHFQIQLVALQSGTLGRQAGRLFHIGGHAAEFVVLRQVSPAVRGIEHVLAEFLAEFGLAFLNLREAGFGLTHQLGTRQHEIAQSVFQRLLLCRIELVAVHGAVLGEQALVSTQSGPEVGDAGQRLVVGGTQFRRVCHGIQVADDAPGAAQLLGGHIEHAGHACPVCREFRRGDGFQRLFGALQQFADGTLDLVGGDRVKAGQVGEVEQGQSGGHESDLGLRQWFFNVRLLLLQLPACSPAAW